MHIFKKWGNGWSYSSLQIHLKKLALLNYIIMDSCWWSHEAILLYHTSGNTYIILSGWVTLIYKHCSSTSRKECRQFPSSFCHLLMPPPHQRCSVLARGKDQAKKLCHLRFHKLSVFTGYWCVWRKVVTLSCLTMFSPSYDAFVHQDYYQENVQVFPGSSRDYTIFKAAAC